MQSVALASAVVVAGWTAPVAPRRCWCRPRRTARNHSPSGGAVIVATAGLTAHSTKPMERPTAGGLRAGRGWRQCGGPRTGRWRRRLLRAGDGKHIRGDERHDDSDDDLRGDRHPVRPK